MRKLFILFLLLAGLFISFALSTPIKPSDNLSATPEIVLPTYPRNPQVDQIFAELGITDIAQVEAKVSDQTSCTPMPQLRACAVSYSDHLSVTFTSNWVNADRFRQRGTVAHEYLHWQWFKGDRARTEDLNAVYPLLVNRMRDYERLGVGSPAFLNEVNSIACTEVADYKLPPTLRQYCASHIPNRSALPSYY